MERLGIEVASEGNDLVNRDLDSAILDHFVGREVLEIERLRHWRSIRETEMQDVAVGDYIVLTFKTELSRLTSPGLAPIRDIVVIGNGLGADKALFEIRVYDAGRLRPSGSLFDRPRARFLGPHGEECDKMQKRVTGADNAAQTGLRQPDRLKVSLLLGQ